MQIGYWCGSGDYMNADVAEVIVYNTALSTTTRQSVEGYLNSRYALTTTQCATPTFSPAAGTFTTSTSVTISTTTGGASYSLYHQRHHAEFDRGHGVQQRGEHHRHLHAAGHRLRKRLYQQ